jgi:hypothetical protein
MSEETIEKVGGTGDVVNPVSRPLKNPPAAETKGVSLGQTRVKWFVDTRPTPKDDTARSLDPYWEISIYTEAEINAIREADKLDPDLAEHYKDLLKD